MNSSTSISEPKTWRRWFGRYIFACVCWLVAIAGVQVTLDPYNTGRLTLFDDYGIAPFRPQLSLASLARRPDVEAAILGNSTIQHLDPERLTRLTGVQFVSLSLPATGPIEQLAVGRWLVRHHDGRSAKALTALVIDIDTRWCRGDGTIELTFPFPFWLYSDDNLYYAVNLVGLRTFAAAAKKVKTILGLTPRLRGRGYRDYDQDLPWNTEADLHTGGMRGYKPLGQNFAGMQQLKDFLPELPAETLLILLHPPRYFASLPAPGSNEAADVDACKTGYRAIAKTRPRTVVVDLLRDSPLVHIDAYFLDRAHYLRPISDAVEDAIADAVRPALNN